MTEVTIWSDSRAQENIVCHCFYCFPIYLPWSDRTGGHDLSFLNVEFQASFFTLLSHLHQQALKNYHVEADMQMSENCSNSVFVWYYSDDRSSSEEWYITVLCHLLIYFYMVVFKLLSFSFILLLCSIYHCQNLCHETVNLVSTLRFLIQFGYVVFAYSIR